MHLYEEITNKIIETLEVGVIPWNCPFKRCALPTNYKTGNPYNGINTIMLWLENIIKGYTSHYWLGFGQAKRLNGKIRKGEKGTKIIAYCTKKVEKENTKESDGNDFAITHFFRTECVFNLDQIDGIEFDMNNKNILEVAELDTLIRLCGAIIKHQGERAYYSLSGDYINMPLKSKFEDTEGYYSTLLHELVHWTGHKDRLNRMEVKKESDRAFEELVAEIGASFLCAEYGISPNIANTSSYVASWLKALQNDKNYIFKAVKSANSALSYLKNPK